MFSRDLTNDDGVLMSPHALANNHHCNDSCDGSTGNKRTLIGSSSGMEMT